MCQDQVGPGCRRQELNSGKGRRDALLAHAHGRSKYHAAVGHNVLINALVRTRDSLQRGAFFEAKAGAFAAAHSKVQLIVFHFVSLAFHKPAAFPGWVGKSAEYALRRGRRTALDNESPVNYGSLFLS